MELKYAKILQKIKLSSSYLYQKSHPSDDYQLEFSKFWIPFSEFQSLQISFPYFSFQPLISGLLFSKRKQPDKVKWFQSRFYCLYKDHLIVYSNKDLQKPKKVLILKGVHLRLLNEILSEDELKQLADDGILEQKSLVLSRGNHFEVFYAGTDEMHRAWFEKFRKCCILHRFKRRYNLLNNIGKGSTSTIYEAVCLSTNRLVAVKIFDKIKIISTSPNISPTDNNNKIFLSIENEINILSRLDHESILQIHEVYEGSKFIVLVFEKLNGGDFYQKLISKSSNFTEDEIKKIMKQLISAVKYLHDKEIMHRDIKPENIFFLKNDELDLKLGDFGLAEYEKKDNLLSIRCGTPGYVAPEIFLNKKYSKKCDMFSLGVLLYVMITRKTLFPGKNCNETLKKNKMAEEILSKVNFSLLNVSIECIDLLRNLLCFNSKMRFSADEAFSHNWLMAKKTGKNHIIFNIINSKMNNTEIYNSPKGKARFLQSNFFLFRKNKGNHFKKGSFQIQPCIRKNSNDQDLLKENKLRETHPNDDNQDNSEVIEFQTAILKPNKSLKKKCSIILMKKEYDEEYNENNEEKSLKKFHNIRTINTLTTISLEELKYIPSRKSSQLGSFLELQSFKSFHEKKVIEQTSEQKKKLKDEEEKEDV